MEKKNGKRNFRTFMIVLVVLIAAAFCVGMISRSSDSILSGEQGSNDIAQETYGVAASGEQGSGDDAQEAGGEAASGDQGTPGTESTEAGEEVFAYYGEEDQSADPMTRLQNADKEILESLKCVDFEETDYYSDGRIQCVAELEEEGIRMYYCCSEDGWTDCVALDIRGEFSYYYWELTSSLLEMPSMYWDEENQRLQVVCTCATGTGRSAPELHLVQKNDAGEWVSNDFDFQNSNASASALYDRIGYEYEEETRMLTVTDLETGEVIFDDMVPFEGEGDVTSITLGECYDFELGETIFLCFTPGYVIDNFVGISQYDDMPDVKIELVICEQGDGALSLEMGTLQVYADGI